MSHASAPRVTFQYEVGAFEDEGEGQAESKSEEPSPHEEAHEEKAPESEGTEEKSETEASAEEEAAGGQGDEGEMKVASKVIAAGSKSAGAVVEGSKVEVEGNEKSKVIVEVVEDVGDVADKKKGKSKGKAKGKAKGKGGKSSGGAKKDKSPKRTSKKPSMANETSMVGLSNEEMVKKFSQSQSQGALKSRSALKAGKAKKSKSRSLGEEEEEEEEGGEYGQGEGEGEGEDEDEGEGQEVEGEMKKRSRRSKSRSALKVKSQKSRLGEGDEGETEKGGEESQEIRDKDKDKEESKISMKRKRSKKNKDEKDEDKGGDGKEKKKKKGKKGKKVKGKKSVIFEEEEEESSSDVDKSRMSLKVDKSAYSSMGRSIATIDGSRSKRRSDIYSKSSVKRKSTSRTLQESGKSLVDGEFSSSSSSSEAVLKKRRHRPVSQKVSKHGKRKVTKKDEEKEVEGEGGAEEEEEVVQKIVEPAVAFTASTHKPDKSKKKAKKEKAGKEKKKKRKRVTFVKTEAQLEEEAKTRAEEERTKAMDEKRGAIAKEKKELSEASLRGEQLDLTIEVLTECDAALEEVTQKEQAAEEWRQYLVCDGLPAPWDVPGMNTYLHLWEKEVYTVSSERCKERTTEAINLLDKLEDILEDPFDKSERKVSDWSWVASRFRSYQALNLEYCTYRLLRDIKSKMNRIDIPTADFRMQEDLFALCLWVSITLPTPAPNPRIIAKPRIMLSWPELAVEIMFPPTLKREMVAIRGMYTKYDHMTDTCESFRVGTLPPYYSKTLKEVCDEEIRIKMRYKYDNRVIRKPQPAEVVQEDGTVVTVEPEPEPEPAADEIAPKVPYQKLDVSPSDHYLYMQSDEVGYALQQLDRSDLPPEVVNLRKYTVLGGLYYLDLFYQPPQPQGMVSYEVFISTLTAPYSLQTAPFVVKYEPPPAHEPGTRRTPEEIEEEILQQEKELDELIFVQITLPKHVYWLESPMIVQWDYDRETWTTHEVFDFKNIEEKGYVTFRTGIFRPIGIATLRWSNLPYQAWEIRPEKDGTVTFQLSCAILTLEFHVQKNTMCVKDIQSAPNEAFDPHLNVYYPFSKLRKIMRSIGIDVFPFFDTFLYVEGTCEKYWPMENHLYFVMAYLSVVYNMTWSRWNMTLDYRSIVYQMRMYRFDRPKQANFDTVLVRAENTVLIDCTEVSQEFSDEPVEGMRFFADLWHMVRTTTTKSTRQRITSADKTMVKTLYRLYKNVRFLSFS